MTEIIGLLSSIGAELLVVFRYIVAHAPELTGLILPPFVDILNKDVHEENERFIVAVLTCFIVALLIHWDEVMGGSLTSAGAYFVLIFSESQILFKLYFQKSFLRLKLDERLGNNDNKGTTSSEAVSQLPQ